VTYFSGDVTKIFFALPILFFAYGSVVTLLPSYKDVKKRMFLPMTAVNLGQILFAAVLYWVMGFFGYVMFLDDTRDNILKNFTDPNDILMTVAKVAIVLVIILSFPLIHWICRESIEELFFSGWEFTWFRWIGEALILCTIAYLLGAFIPSITIVFGFTGATGGALVVFVYPSLLVVKLAKQKWLKVLGVMSAIISIILGGLCTLVVILDTFKVLK
jgi:amino acid permease